MSTTIWHYPGTVTEAVRSDSNQQDWNNPANAKTDDGNYADVLVDKDEYTDWLRVTQFGFDDDLPVGATILGIELEYERQSDGHLQSNHHDSALYLRKTSGQVGDNKASEVLYENTWIVETYGGAADDWNAGLTAADIRSSDFGMDYSVNNGGGAGNLTPKIDFVRIRITYEEEEESEETNPKLISRSCSDGISLDCGHETWEWDKR